VVDTVTGNAWQVRKRYTDFRKVKAAVGGVIAHVKLPKKESGQTDEVLERRYVLKHYAANTMCGEMRYTYMTFT
jgi:hypothetical protein